MEKYIKPECKIVEVKFEGNLMQASNIPPTSDTDLGWNDEVSDNLCSRLSTRASGVKINPQCGTGRIRLNTCFL
mgnify:CR=1 FL=1